MITLTTDFGLSDPFVGMMKGVILTMAPGAQIVDITHGVSPYSVTEASFVLNSMYRYFPTGTVHVVVVDPGVGSPRRPIAAAARGHFFVAPDNGVLSPVLGVEAAVYHVTNRRLFLKAVSRTFHGRDVFAPVAAHLTRGIPLESAGPRITDFIQRPLPQPRRLSDNRLIGTVLRIDRFGNIITNFRTENLTGNFVIHAAGVGIQRLCSNFSEVGPGEVFAIEGSTGYIELALSQGSAAGRLRIECGAEIEVETEPSNQ